MGDISTSGSPAPAATSQRGRTRALRSWQGAAAGFGVVGGAAITAGAFLPWVSTFAGLIEIPGVRGINGRIFAAAGVVIAVGGLYHAIRGSNWARWLVGVGGFGALGFASYLLIQLAASLRSLGGDSMVIARGGPGLWVVAAGALLAFTTLFLPPSGQATLRREGDGLLVWAADSESRGARRALQLGLGAVWLLDAALQYQPYMFTRSFATQILAPAAMGSPAVVANPVLASSQLIESHTVVFNALFATVQLLLAAGLLWRRTVRAALAGTIVWGLLVWWLGESLGGIFTGTATPVTGAPGAALLYVVIAILVWPRRGHTLRLAVADGSSAGARWVKVAWVVLWGSAAAFALQPANSSPSGLRDVIAGMASGEPGWIAAMDRGVASAIGTHGLIAAIALAIVLLAIGAGVLSPRTIRPALLAAIGFALVVWVVGENFGGMLTGTGTDPDTGPLLVLLVAAFWPRTTANIPEASADAQPPRPASAAPAERAARAAQAGATPAG